MCGIVGAYRHKLPPSIHIDDMLRSLSHRGPDDEVGLSLFHNNIPFCQLGATRLSIIDPLSGMQPISDPSNRFWVVMNGEIYNHNTLRRECIGNGHVPLNGSDTAVVATLCSFLPIPQVLERLRGMFAIAITDTLTGELYLVRDRMGVKPLYWATDSQGITFWASEARALLKQPSIKKEANLKAYEHFLLFEYVPSPWTMWKDIHKLQPGHYLHIKDEKTQMVQWWRPPQIVHSTGGSYEYWKKSLYYGLRLATNLRAQADVEVGTLLSGGIDSATITALAAQEHPRIRSFSLSMPVQGFDEAQQAKETAEHLQLTHHTQSLNFEEYPSLLSEIFNHMDEPLADSSLIPMWGLMKCIKEQGLKCVLSGDGADESFMGYPTYLAHNYRRVARPLNPFVKHLSALRPTRYSGLTSDYMLQRYGEISEPNWARRHQLWMGAWLPEEIKLKTEFWAITDQWSKTAGNDKVGRAMYLDQRMYLAECVLTKVDRSSMANGVEVRSPFMDHHIVELASQMPKYTKWHRGRNKRIIRDLCQSSLPTNVQTRKKKGFGSPIAIYLQTAGKHWLDDLAERCEDWIPPSIMKKSIDEHLSKKRDHRRRLWSAICLSQWKQRYAK